MRRPSRVVGVLKTSCEQLALGEDVRFVSRFVLRFVLHSQDLSRVMAHSVDQSRAQTRKADI